MWTAIGTGLLAIATFVLAQKTAAGNEQSDRQHKENLRPYCLIQFDRALNQVPFGPDFQPRKGRLAGPVGQEFWLETTKDFISINARLFNKGLGPAKTISLYLNKRIGSGEDDVIRLTTPKLVAPILAPNESLPISILIGYEADIMLKKRVEGNPNLPEEEKLEALIDTARQTAEVVIEYQDVFDGYYRTVHPNGVWMDFAGDIATHQDTPAGAQEILERPDRRPPVFLSGRQSSTIESKWFAKGSGSDRPEGAEE